MTEYIAGNNSTVQYQSQKVQNNIVEEFKKGMVNIIVATSILEEGLDIQSCNLVIRFDPCSRVPSDSYLKPSPRFLIDDGTETCTLYLPKSCPILRVNVQGNVKTIRQKACLEACKQLHACGALTDYLIPDIVVEEKNEVGAGNDLYEADKHIYFPPELASEEHLKKKTNCFCYIIGLTQHFDYDLPVSDVVLAARSELDPDISSFTFDLEADRGSLSVQLKYFGVMELSSEQVSLCRRFQFTLFRILFNHGVEKLEESLNSILSENRIHIDYLLLPSVHKSFDWNTISSLLLFPRGNDWKEHLNCHLTHAQPVHTKDGRLQMHARESSYLYPT